MRRNHLVLPLLLASIAALTLTGCDAPTAEPTPRNLGPSPRMDEDPPPTEGGSSTGAATGAEEEEECGDNRALPEAVWEKCHGGLTECIDGANEDEACGEPSCELCFTDFELCAKNCEDMSPAAREVHCGDFVHFPEMIPIPLE